MSEEALFRGLAGRAHDPRRATDMGANVGGASFRPPPAVAGRPATGAEIAELEQKVGVPLPSLLRALLTSIGNGGFGPGYGLLSTRKMLRELGLLAGAHANWPLHVVPVVEWGCGIFTCADLSDAAVRLYRYDPDVEPEDLRSWLGHDPLAPGLSPEAPDLRNWLLRWLEGEDLFPFELPPENGVSPDPSLRRTPPG